MCDHERNASPEESAVHYEALSTLDLGPRTTARLLLAFRQCFYDPGAILYMLLVNFDIGGAEVYVLANEDKVDDGIIGILA